MSTEQITVGAPTTHDIVVYVDGTATDLDAAPTYAITDADGTAVASGTASVVSTGRYQVTIPSQSQVGELTVAWSGTIGSGSAWSAETTVEVVGDVLFTIADLRAYRNGDLASSATYSTAAIVEARAAITDEFARICGVQFVPRYGRVRVDGSGKVTQWVDPNHRRITTVLGCTINGTTITASNFDTHATLPVVYRTNGVFPVPSSSTPRNVTLSYRHGHEDVPGDIRRAALIVARARLIADVVGSGVPDNASSWSDAAGTFTSFAPSNRTDRWYGIPAVDIPLARHRLISPIGIG